MVDVHREILLARTRCRYALSIVRKTAEILGRTIWLATCLTALVYAYKGYQGSSDWKLEEGVGLRNDGLVVPSFLPRRRRVGIGRSGSRTHWPRTACIQ